MAFATPSLTLNRYRFGPLRSSQLALVTLIQMNKRPAPYNLRFTFKEQTERRNRPRGFPSHEIHSLTPLHRIHSIEFTPRTRKTSSFGPTPTRRQILFHSRGFSPPQWFTPQSTLRVYCAPLPILGFALFPVFHSLTAR